MVFLGNPLTEHASNIVAQATGRNADTGTIVADELALVRRVQAGQPEAYGELVKRYQDRIYNLTYRMCNRHEDAEELAQEVFLKAFEKIRQFSGHESVLHVAVPHSEKHDNFPLPSHPAGEILFPQRYGRRRWAR